ncbi:MAG: peptidase M3, partial [Acidiphilium sp.]|nr:peptidase M3 [Acidiphilium sp.]
MKFDEIEAVKPTRESLAEAYAVLNGLLDRGAVTEALAEWEGLRRATSTWSSLTHLRFSQDTSNAEYKAEREYADALGPVISDHETSWKNRLLALDPALIEGQYGRHAVDIWRNDVTTFSPAIAADLEEESKLEADYTALLASAAFVFNGETVNLAGLTPYGESLDREIRHQSAAARWGFFSEHGAKLDNIYDKLVKLRHKMARALGDENFTALGYRRMGRLDYGPAQVATYRAEVLKHVTPLV